MGETVLSAGTVFGATSIIFGAFGAHALKKVLPEERIASFEIGVRYQMYSALFLLLIGFHLPFDTGIERWAFYGTFYGTIMFSGSIYLLSFKDFINKSLLKFIGPITPLGGLLMIVGWICLLLTFFR